MFLEGCLHVTIGALDHKMLEKQHGWLLKLHIKERALGNVKGELAKAQEKGQTHFVS